jgi:hypothetical protein
MFVRPNNLAAIDMAKQPQVEARPPVATEVNALTMQMGTLLVEAFQILVTTLLTEGDVEGFNRLANYVLTEHERLLAGRDLR